MLRSTNTVISSNVNSSILPSYEMRSLESFIVSRTNAIGQDGLQVVREVRDDGENARRLGWKLLSVATDV
jgi:hypothetical protein